MMGGSALLWWGYTESVQFSSVHAADRRRRRRPFDRQGKIMKEQTRDDNEMKPNDTRRFYGGGGGGDGAVLGSDSADCLLARLLCCW